MSQQSISRFALALLATLATGAQAQTVVDLQYGSSTCSFTTNANGVTYDPTSGHLIATNTDITAFSGPCGGQPATPSITQNLNATPTAPQINQAFTLAWNTANVDYCRTDGTTMPVGASISNWPLSGQICSGASCAPGSLSVTAAVAGTYAFNLQCFKTGNSTPATTSTSVVVAGSTDTTCTGVTPVFPTRANTVGVKYGNRAGIFVQSSHDQVFNDDPSTSVEGFPQLGNRSVSFQLSGGQYLALPFTVPANMTTSAAGQWGAFDTNYIGGAWPTNNGISYSISQCPGDFSAALSSACKKQWTGQDGDYLVYAAPEVSDPTGSLCKLTRGKTYYLNVITGTLANPTTPQCTSGQCAVSMSYFRLQN